MAIKRVAQIVCKVTLVFCVPVSAYGQEAWLQKPYLQWSRDDIVQIISKSPWAQVRQADRTTADYTPTGSLPAVTIRLRSAMPVRQALVRLKQIEANYEKMDEKQRGDFDAKMKGTLQCPACADNYVISLGPPISRTTPLDNGVLSLKHATLSLLVKYAYISNEHGERRELVHFVPPRHDGDEANFFFPRLNNEGYPLLTADNTKLIFYFEPRNNPSGLGLTSIPSRFEFDVSKIIINGRVEF